MLNATLVEKKSITPELIVIKVKPDFDIPDFEPGQYVTLGLPEIKSEESLSAPAQESAKEKFIKRAYSIASAPHEKEFLEFYIALVYGGALTPRLNDLNIGDRVSVGPKIVGHFTLHDVPAEKNLWFFSTGTGLAPFISMLRKDGLSKRWNSFGVIHGVRKHAELGYKDELLAFQNKGVPLTYLPYVSRDDETDGIKKGYVQDCIKSKIISLSPDQDHVFLCGNPAMIEDMTTLLGAQGYTVHSKKNPGSLHVEKYW